jgi:hypothetical protein
MIDLLHGIESIDWRSLSHAYGTAEDIPELVRARASQDSATASEADHEFYGNIWHQGTIYSATPPAAHYLARLLQDEATLDRPGLAVLLGTVVRGSPSDPGSDRLRQQTIDEVSIGLDSYWALLDIDDGLHLTVPYLLAGLPSAHDRIWLQFPERITTITDGENRAGLVMALIESTTGRANEADSTFQALLADPSSLVRFLAAVGLCLGGASYEPGILAANLLEHLATDPSNEQRSDNWVWDDCQTLLGRVLGSTERDLARQIVLAMLPTLPALDKYTASTIAYDALSLFFDSTTVKRLPAMESTHHTLLTQLARDTNVTYWDHLVDQILKQFDARDMRQLSQRLTLDANDWRT